MDFAHIPVLLEPCMELLNLAQRPEGVFVDATLGGGGHTAEILARTRGRVIGIDRDTDALRAAGERLAAFGDRFCSLHGNYANIISLLQSVGVDKVDGVLMDLGVSSYQLDNPERGFSFHHDAPLDMRMDQSAPLTAEVVLNTYPEKEIARILWEYGEEKWAARIAKFIVEARPLRTTMDLVRVIDAAVPAAARREVSHPARRTFQAIRIEVNSELSLLPGALRDALACLKPGGRLVVITFHSWRTGPSSARSRRCRTPAPARRRARCASAARRAPGASSRASPFCRARRSASRTGAPTAPRSAPLSGARDRWKFETIDTRYR